MLVQDVDDMLIDNVVFRGAERPEYGILCFPAVGHVIANIARRPATASPFGAYSFFGVNATIRDGLKIAEGTLAVEMGATLEDLLVTIHPHPTLSEAIMEAAEVAAGGAVHLNPPRKIR